MVATVKDTGAGNPRPFHPVTPGSVLLRELEAREWTQRELASRIGRPVQAVNEIVRGRKQIVAETALELADALGTSAEFWMRLETNYRLDLARRRRRAGKRGKRGAAVAARAGGARPIDQGRPRRPPERAKNRAQQQA
ncbi:MAG: HigA family addiction module antitoxin [Tepidisphaeraceae bacterium]